MTLGESNNSNAVELNGIVMEISQPDIIVLPIPENRTSANTTVLLGIRITNNTSTPFRLNLYETLIPELVASDGQVQKRLLVSDEPVASIQPNIPVSPGVGVRLSRFISNLLRQAGRSAPSEINYAPSEINYLLVKPRESKSICLTARLSWQNNLLQLKIPTTPDYYQSPTSSNNFWSFDEVQLGNYQLRFIYASNRETRASSDLNTEEKERQEIHSGQLATPFVNFRLVQPVEPDRSAVEVDGIRFETLVPERVLTVPKKSMKLLYVWKNLLPITAGYPYPEVSVQIGIRITNKTSTPLRFDFHKFLIPKLVGADGQIRR